MEDDPSHAGKTFVDLFREAVAKYPDRPAVKDGMGELTYKELDHMSDYVAQKLTENGFGKTPVCMAKTQMSLSDDAKKKGRPQDFVLTVRSMKVSAGAGFIVALTGQMMTMPGLPKKPAAENICINEQGQIDGIF